MKFSIVSFTIVAASTTVGTPIPITGTPSVSSVSPAAVIPDTGAGMDSRICYLHSTVQSLAVARGKCIHCNDQIRMYLVYNAADDLRALHPRLPHDSRYYSADQIGMIHAHSIFTVFLYNVSRH